MIMVKKRKNSFWFGKYEECIEYCEDNGIGLD